MAFNQVPSSSGGNISSRITDAKGDIIAATSADVVSTLAVGADGTVLTAASGQATGLQWTTPASGGMTLLASGNLSNYTNITGLNGNDYVRFEAHLAGSNNGAYGAGVSYNINAFADGGYNQTVRRLGIVFGGQTTSMAHTASNSYIGIGNVYGTLRPVIINYLNPRASTGGKATDVNVHLDEYNIAHYWGAHRSTTAAITSLQFQGFNGGTYRIYGVK